MDKWKKITLGMQRGTALFFLRDYAHKGIRPTEKHLLTLMRLMENKYDDE